MSALLNLLTLQTGLSETDLRRIIRTAPRRYKVFEIPKRSGGMRTIAQPARELKFIQRVLVDHVLRLCQSMTQRWLTVTAVLFSKMLLDMLVKVQS